MDISRLGGKIPGRFPANSCLYFQCFVLRALCGSKLFSALCDLGRAVIQQSDGRQAEQWSAASSAPPPGKEPGEKGQVSGTNGT
jgi:hypothetical protein